MFATFQSFDESTERFDSYIKRLEQHFILYDVNEDKKVPALITFMGAKLYSLVKNLTFPASPEEKTYKELVDILSLHLCPPPNKISERIKFRKRFQFENESIQDFCSELRRLTAYCMFTGDSLDENLLEQFLRGLKNSSIQTRLLSQVKDLTFEKAVEQALIMQNAENDLLEMKIKNVNLNKISSIKSKQSEKHSVENKLKSKVNKSNTENKNKLKCYRCGSETHLANKCKYINITCNSCKKVGHLARVCRSTNTQKKPMHALDTIDILSLDSSLRKNEPIKVRVMIENKAYADMELDTGSAISAVPIKRFRRVFLHHKMYPTDIHLKTATGEIFTPAGFVNVNIQYENTSKMLKLYLINEDNFPLLLGRDWLQELNLFPNKLNSVHSTSVVCFDDKLRGLLKEYADLFSQELSEIQKVKAELYLEKDAKPIFCKPRTVTYALRSAVDQEIERLVNDGILIPVNTSKWATPIVPVVKPNGKIRLCGDFKVTVNKFLKVEKYPLPKIEDILANLAGGQHFTKIDLNQAYLQLAVDENSRELLTINTQKGLFQFTRLPYGISSAPAIWQRTIENILKGIEGVTIFIDDVCITGETDEIHLQRLKQVFDRFREYNIKINEEKSNFLSDSITYCGYKIDKHGIHKTEDKIKAILNAPRPTDITQVKAFLGLVSYYSKFVPNLSTLVHPLNNLLRKNVSFKWTAECEKSFKAIKAEICSERVLTHFNPSLALVLATDASAYGISAVLSHIMPDKSEKPIAFVSRTLTNSEKRYSQVDKEALAIIFGVKKFFQYLYGHRFTLYTDSKPLVSIFSPTKSIPLLSAARMQRYALYLQSFQYDIRYKRTVDNGNADALSRLPLRSEDLPTPESPDEAEIFQINQINTLPLTPKSLSAASKTDPMLRQMYYHLISGSELPKHLLYGGKQEEFTLQQGCILRGYRVIIPEVYRKQILDELHFGHFGVVKMKLLARSFVWWPGIDKDIESMVKNCLICINSKNNPPKSEVHHWEWPTTPWQRIHIDYLGPVNGKMLLLVVDAHSKWPEAFIVHNMTTENTITCLSSLFARYGYPLSLVSDNGAQFTSEEFKNFLRSKGIKHHLSAPYHPSTNGQAERYVQIIKKGLKALSQEPGSLQAKLNDFLLQYRKMPHVTTGESPASLFLKRNIRTKIDLVLPNVEDYIQRKQNRSGIEPKAREFNINERVAVRNYTPEAKWKIGKIVGKEGKLHYKIKVGENVWKRHIDQITNIGSDVPLQDETEYRNPNLQARPDECSAPSLSTFIPTKENSTPAKQNSIPANVKDTENMQTSSSSSPGNPSKSSTNDSTAPGIQKGKKFPIAPFRRSTRNTKPPDRLQYASR